MLDIDFIYNQKKISIQCNLDDKMKDIFHKFIIKSEKKLEDIYFLYNGEKIENKLTLNEIMTSESKQNNKIQILVNDINNNDSDDNESFKPSKHIICPNCKENIRISIYDYKIKLYECKNNHIKDNIPFNKFENTQMINEKKITCEKCKMSNKNDTYENKFYRCLDCKMNICPLCKTSHDKSHNIIDYDQKYFICDLHNELYNSYCKDCLKNICVLCENDHISHNIISFGRIMPNIKAIKEEMNNQREKIDQFINGIEEIINKLNNLIDNINIYYRIYDNIISNYGTKNRNFNILQNIIDIRNYNNDFYKTINKINDEENIVNKFSYLIDIYEKMNLNNDNSNDENYKKEEKNEIKDTVLENKKTINDANVIDNNNENIVDEKNDTKNEIILPKTNNNDLENKKEEKIVNFDNLDITQLKVKDSYKIKNKIKAICKLKDEKITLIDEKGIFYIFNLIDKITEIYNVDLNLKNVDHMIQLDDGNLILADDKLHLYKLNDKEIEKIESFDIYSDGIYKLSKDKLITYRGHEIYLYSYENNKIIDQKHSFEISELNCKFDFFFELFNGVTYTSLHKILVINENEIFIFYSYYGVGSINYHYFNFYNVKKGKSIDSIKIKTERNYPNYFCLYDKNILFASVEKYIYIIDLKKHSVKKKISLENKVNSIISLNEKYILVQVDEKNGFFYQYEFENKKKFKLIGKINIKEKSDFIGKCNGNIWIMNKENQKFIMYS